ncbi:hypothetical protein ABL78_6761 [Leptomonas seymouri]|uniref:DUF4833 domain-containing protein n=1 Tax=Leptomonas seymouri TaxID=5684 RepID=A0A0N0P3Y3_LEPSE|nr:hypothetical protein ABL78_6761 [Leptomonas seymouri]|eukprot:KPI84187.1 hypothetical protein ABL78_6761 [Leptomonas seymouri]
MSIPLVANAKTVKEDSRLFFAVTEKYAVPAASECYQSPRRFNQLVRSRLRQRNRFNHDHHDTCMYIARSKNANVVAYTANLVDARTKQSVDSGIGRQCILCMENPIHPYFVNLEPSYVEERRRKGTEYDCDDLNFLERTMAYGVSATPVNTDDALQYWGKKTPEAFAELQRSWVAGGSAAVPEDEAEAPNTEESSSGKRDGAVAAGKPRGGSLTADSLNTVLKSWWTSFHPYVSHFVALPTWPGLVLCLPPVSKTEGSRRSSVSDVSLGKDGAKAKAASVRSEDADSLPEAEKTRTTYGSHTEPSPVTPTTGILSDEDTVVAILSFIDGELSVVENVYVSSIEPKRFYQLPKVEYIDVHGASLATGKPTYERRTS